MIMIQGIGKEVAVFVQAVLAGNIVCLVYNVLRVVRRIVKHNLFWVSVEDVVFWLGAGMYLFLELFRTCNGSIRWYFVIGVLAGGIISHFIIEKIIKKYLAKKEKKE